MSEGALTRKELEIVRADDTKNEFTLNKRLRYHAWCVLGVLTLGQISNQWQRFLIGSTYNYVYEGDGDPNKYQISTDIPGFTKNKFGLLSGAMFTIFFSITVLFAGVLADNMSRRILMSTAAILWSLTSITTSISKTFFGIAASRMALGFFEAFIGPSAYSLIADYFPPEIRTTAIGIFAFGIYIGVAFSSLNIIMITLLGWRLTYAITGIIGIGIGILCFIFIQDPIRGRYEPRVAKVAVEEPEETEPLTTEQ